MTDEELKNMLSMRLMAVRAAKTMVEKGIEIHPDVYKALSTSIQSSVLAMVMIAKLNKGATKDFMHLMLEESWDLVGDIVKELDLLDEVNAKSTAKLLSGMWGARGGSA